MMNDKRNGANNRNKSQLSSICQFVRFTHNKFNGYKL
jgi:hypothetical protein